MHMFCTSGRVGVEASVDSMDPLDYYEAVKLQKMKRKEAKKTSVGCVKASVG